MPSIPAKSAARITSGLKTFQTILAAAKSRDVNESDTAIIVTDVLGAVFGYDKYTDITSEHAIRATFCDLAISFEGKIQLLVEVKAVGLELKDNHVRQVVDYAANKGVDWVILTNGISWRVYRVIFGKPIDQELVLEFDFLQLSARDEDDLFRLFLLSKEGWTKEHLSDFHQQKQVLSRFSIGAMVLSDTLLEVLRRELKRLCPDVKIQTDQIKNVLLHEVLKREVVEGEKAEEARKKISRSANRALRTRSKDEANVGNAASTSNAIPEPPAAVPPVVIISTDQPRV